MINGFYLKVIESNVISDNAFINNCCLCYIYNSIECDKVITSLITKLNNSSLKEMTFLEKRELSDSERNFDIGIIRLTKAFTSSIDQAKDHIHNCIINCFDFNEIMIFPIYNIYNVQMDYIPKHLLIDGVFTVDGIKNVSLRINNGMSSYFNAYQNVDTLMKNHKEFETMYQRH